MSPLRLHRGAHEVSVDELRGIQTPEGKGRWFPTPHIEVLQSVRSVLESSNYEIKAQKLAVAKEGQRFFGILDLRTEIGKTESLTIGVRNSHDKTFSMGFCCGARTFICDNLAFLAEIVIGKKHTINGNDRFQEGIGHGVNQLAQFADVQTARLKEMIEAWTTREEAESLILIAGEKKIIGWQTVPKVLAEYREPSHDEHKELTRYGLLQAFTEVLKPRFQSQPLKAAFETIRLHQHLAV